MGSAIFDPPTAINFPADMALIPGWSDSGEAVSSLLVEEPNLGARESWVLMRLNFAIVSTLASNSGGSLAPETLFLLDRSQKLRRRPDLAFISAQRWPINQPAPAEAAWDVIPDLAVEIVSPTDLIDDLMSKIHEYFAVGVRLVWVIYPKFQNVYIYQSPTSVQIFDQNGILDGGEIIPGFAMPLNMIFPDVPNGSMPDAGGRLDPSTSTE